MTEAETEYHLTIAAGHHARQHCPVSITLPDALQTEASSRQAWHLAGESGETLSLQITGEKTAVCIVPDLPAGQTRRYRLERQDAGQGANHPSAGVSCRDVAGRHVEIHAGDALLTRYIYGNVPARPYFYPLFGPDNTPLTRAYPMQTDVPGETADHPHHRSLWIAFGDVNGADNWSEEAGHGYTLHQSLNSLVSGPVMGRFATTSLWADATRKPLLRQHLQVTAWATKPDLRLLDFDIRLEAAFADVHFGDTKEGGILSARVASSLDAARGGLIENVYGGINEGETWGKAAHWCDYCGQAGDQHVGIAILDHPHSFRYPTHWHVRNYGLMTANPFGYAAYTQGVKNGAHTLPQGDSLTFRYRVVLHRGDAAAGRIREHYLDFVSPPTAKFA